MDSWYYFDGISNVRRSRAGSAVDVLQPDWHLARYETTRDEVARLRNSFTEKWVKCETSPFFLKARIFLALL
jgi:hypothetical protein